MTYINHFSEKSENYRQFRPIYPQALYQYLISLIKKHDLAWDCGTGNGQAAFELANYFAKVIATDISEAQLAAATPNEKIEYIKCPCDRTPIASHSTDLITVAQALHWFPLNEFYDEVKRVAKPGSYIAAWSYSLGKINPAADKIIRELYDGILGDAYWPTERRYIDQEYQTILFPFEKLVTPEFFMEKELNTKELIGYLNTWSAVKEYEKVNGKNPVELIQDSLSQQLGDQTFIMKWSIHLLVGKI